jgi:hypothetical protein
MPESGTIRSISDKGQDVRRKRKRARSLILKNIFTVNRSEGGVRRPFIYFVLLVSYVLIDIVVMYISFSYARVAVLAASAVFLIIGPAMGFSAQEPASHSTVGSPTRRALLGGGAVAALVAQQPLLSLAFDGGGASSYSGRTMATTATKAKGYRDRIAADVKDFNALGAAIDRGETSGELWVAFFIPYQRREMDASGRTYAAQVDLLGVARAGGAALLLANTYAKPNKPPDNLPQYKKSNALAKSMIPLEEAGKSGDAGKAKKAWDKSAAGFAEYLEAVDMPSDLADPLYK